MKIGKSIGAVLVAVIMLLGAFMVVGDKGVQNVKAASDEGLVAYWDFDEGSGNILHDKSGNGNDGTIYGATWVDGVRGKALQFKRDDGDYVEINPAEILKSIENSFTVSVWIYLKSYPQYGYHGETIFMINRPYNTGNENLFGIYASDSDINYNMKFYYSDSYSSTNYALSLGKWTFFSLVAYSNGTLDYYVDGEKVYSDSWQPPLSVEDMVKAWIGTDIDYDNEKTDFLDGKIDELHIYNRALSAEEIKEQYDEIMGDGHKGSGFPWLFLAVGLGAVIATVAVVAYIAYKKHSMRPPENEFIEQRPPQQPPYPPYNP